MDLVADPETDNAAVALDGSEPFDEDEDGSVSDSAPSPTRLPSLLKHTATARESDTAKQLRLRRLRGSVVAVRHGPPAIDTPKVTSPEVVFPPVAAKRDADSVEKLRVLQAMEASLRVKQADTAKYFRVLYALQQQSSSGSMKALLQQIFNVLYRATYRVGSGGVQQRDAGSNNADDAALDVDPSAMDELAGHEFFSLYTHAQQTLELVSVKKQHLDTKLQMERSLEDELVGVLHQLDRDLRVIRTQHLENHERVEAERGAVAQLEEDHAALISQEQRIRKECDGLAQQAETQRTQLSDLQSKSAYLDFISRIPLKKHLEQKKLKEQEDLLQSVVRQEEEENRKLEAELAALNEQIVGLASQYESDVAHRSRLAVEVRDTEQILDATRLEFERIRDCHTPRPAWESIVERIPELSTDEDVEWDEMQATMGSSPAMMLRRAEAAARIHGENNRNQPFRDENESVGGANDGDDGDDEDGEKEANVGSQTQQLVREILQWIERLQKHCGVNLHLSRIWHDVEEARVELNILQHQLDRAIRKHTKHPFGGGGSAKLLAVNGTPQAKQRPKQEYICALGVHAEIPVFLRHQGKVKRHPLKKGELETLVRKVWTEKRQREMRNPHLRLPLEEVLYEKLHRKYGFQPLIAEWGYNILLSLDLFAWDAEVELFLLCLTNAVSDRVFLDQEAMIGKCGSLLAKLSESYSNESFVVERRVLLKDALVALRKFFPLKTSMQLQALEKAMIRDMHKMKRGGNDSVLYIDDVLSESVSYPRGFFVKAIRTQHFKEIQDYYVSLTTEIESRDEHRTGELPLHQVREAMLAVDPLADPSAVCNAIMRGMGIKTRSQLEMHKVVPYRALLKHMNTTGLLKFALNFDANAELNWQRRGTIDVSLLSGGSNAARNSVGVRKSVRSVVAPETSPGKPVERLS